MGANGMLGRALQREFAGHTDYNIVTFARKDADVNLDLADSSTLINTFRHFKFDVVINAAAIVDFNLCEQNPDLAYSINAKMPGIVAELCDDLGIYFIQVSTDHYYQGDGRKAHDELEGVVLLNKYAKSKYQGEINSLRGGNSLVLRTNIVGVKKDIEKMTFLEWAIDSVRRNRNIKLFYDFFTSSMFVEEFTRVLLDLIKSRPVGIFNIASSTVSSKEEFVLALSRELFQRIPTYNTVSVNDTLKVKRADSLGLDVSNAEKLLGYRMPSLEHVIYDIRKACIRDGLL